MISSHDDSERMYEALPTLLNGTWRGAGRGTFPTIDDFEFEEVTTFRVRDLEPATIAYEQRTMVVGANAIREPSHWESGFFLLFEDGRIEVLNAQNSGRVEVLSGSCEIIDATTARLELASVVHAHDPRMIATRRILEVRGDELHYEVHMQTTNVDVLQKHLWASLRRDSPA
ncbi:MAG: FABP family protein [Planctomycetes bacterium]|nr:FABP family protein [Planctomycetota bacterium]